MAKGDLTPRKYQVQLGNVNTDVIPDVGANIRIHITSIRVINGDSASQWFTLHSIPSGQSAGDQYLLSPKQSVLDGTNGTSGGGIYSDSMAYYLNTGDKVSGLSGTASKITVNITALEEALT